jgi:DNA-binding LytR/AlgR family response regulator
LTAFAGWRIVRDQAPAIKAATSPIFQLDRSPNPFAAHETYSPLVLKLLSEWEEQLPEKHFARIHRSTIINIEFVERVEKWFNYSFKVHLRGVKEPLTMSRRCAAKLKDKLS